MKRLLIVLLLCFAITASYSQKALSQKDQKVLALQVTALKNEANKALAIKDYKTALAKFENVQSISGSQSADNVMVYTMGTCAYSLNDMPKALKYFDACIAAGHNLDMAFQYKACVMKAQKNDEGYIKTLKEGLAKVPTSKSMKATLGKYYFEEGDKFYHKGMDCMKNVSDMVKAGKASSADKSFKELNEKARQNFKECIKWMDMSLEANPTEENSRIIKKNCATQLQTLI
jgi:tetratricopeptide (TPR) repeat protein